jgi:hypothetical protein
MIDDSFRAELKGIIREVLEELRPQISGIQTGTSNEADMPPEPRSIRAGKRGGRREDRAYFKLAATIDIVLWQLFDKERRRLRLSNGRMLDVILWRAFGRPRLSYMQDGESQGSPLSGSAPPPAPGLGGSSLKKV